MMDSSTQVPAADSTKPQSAGSPEHALKGADTTSSVFLCEEINEAATLDDNYCVRGVDGPSHLYGSGGGICKHCPLTEGAHSWRVQLQTECEDLCVGFMALGEDASEELFTESGVARASKWAVLFHLAMGRVLIRGQPPVSFAESANLEAQGTELELSIDIDQGKAGLHVTGGQEPFEVSVQPMLPLYLCFINLRADHCIRVVPTTATAP
jgi:hypothetical protein